LLSHSLLVVFTARRNHSLALSRNFPARGSSRLHTTKGRKPTTQEGAPYPRTCTSRGATSSFHHWSVRTTTPAFLSGVTLFTTYIRQLLGRSIPLLPTLLWSTANAACNTCITYEAVPALQKVPNPTDTSSPTQPHVLCHGQASASSPRLLG
jgi:hypothetical protein